MKITDEARGRTCQIRLFGCLHDYGVVACHYPLTNHTGMALKSDDILAAWGCARCHDICDGRRRSHHESADEIEIAHLRGVLRTQAQLRREGKLPYDSK